MSATRTRSKIATRLIYKGVEVTIQCGCEELRVYNAIEEDGTTVSGYVASVADQVSRHPAVALQAHQCQKFILL